MRQFTYTIMIVLLGAVVCGGEPVDLLIKEAKVIDGTGRPWFKANVAVSGDEVIALERDLNVPARKVIEAKGLTLAPGFIDIHSHSDKLLLRDGRALGKIYQGVTTEVLGEGFSAGPALGQRPAGSVTTPNGTVRWNTLAEYFSLLERHETSVNVISYVGHAGVWQCVMGNSFERPSEAQMMEMEKLVREAMQQGARGLSSQVMTPPGSLARTEDMIRLAKQIAPFDGLFSIHIRNEGLDVFAAIKEAIQIARMAKVRLDIIHLKIADQQYWGQMGKIVQLIEDARDEEIDVQANVYPYTRGNNNLRSIVPPWAHEGGEQKMLQRLASSESRDRIIEDIENGIDGWYNHYTAVGKDWGRMLVSGEHKYKGLTMDRVFALRGTTENKVADMLDMLIENGGGISTVFAHHDEPDMLLALSQPWCSVGSDGSAYAVDGPLREGNPHPRNFGAFPRLLGYYARERKALTLEAAIQKATWLNATKVGLSDRGKIAVGMKADLVLFDSESIIDKSEYTAPFQYGEGIAYVIVNGKVTVSEGKHLGVTAGRVLRRE
jgi:N-acyl-D-aspartate/D-glutamate deacylase